MTASQDFHRDQQATKASRAASEAADRREKERSVVALERIADALENLVAIQRGHADGCAWFSTSGLECDCDLRRARRSRNQGDDNG